MKNTLTLLFSLLTISLAAQAPTLVTDFNAGALNAFDEFNFKGIAIGDALVFPISKAGTDQELGVLRNGNLSLLKEIYPGFQGSTPRGFTRYNDLVIFSALDDQNDWAIWQTDGTEAGTVLLHDPGTLESSRPQGFTVTESGKLYYTYSSTLYAYDGSTHTEVFDGVFFSTDFNSQSNAFGKYQNELAFLIENDLDEIELYAVENGEAQLLGKTPGTSGFASFYGLMELDGGLIFTVEDLLGKENSDTYFYDNATQTLNSFTIDGEARKCRRLIPYSKTQSLAMVLDKGYLLLNGSDNQEETLFNSPDVSITSGQIINTGIYQDKILFNVNDGFFGDDYLVYSGGTASTTQSLFEINFLSNIITEDKYAFAAQGVSNGFEPELYQIDMSDGSFETLHSFDQSSIETNSVLPLGVQDNKLYLLINLDPAVGRELYVMDLDIPNAVRPVENTPFELQTTSESFQILAKSNSKAQVNIYDAAGRLVETMQVGTNSWTDISHLQGICFLECVVDGQRLTHKFFGY